MEIIEADIATATDAAVDADTAADEAEGDAALANDIADQLAEGDLAAAEAALAADTARAEADALAAEAALADVDANDNA
ncbi:MAG: hypothetical protein EBU43_07230 [Actinobacteria bacterium]|nr:hypothetical protein [Actinomycetota bacterium]